MGSTTFDETIMADLNIDHQELYKEIRMFLLGLFPDAKLQIIQALQNNQPLPRNAIVMTVLFTNDLDYSVTNYDRIAGKAYVQNSVEVRLQIDFYGEFAQRRSRIVDNLWRNPYGYNNLNLCKPLYVQSNQRQPYINDSNNYEDRFVLDLSLQYNPEVSFINQDFVDDAEVTINPVS